MHRTSYKNNKNTKYFMFLRENKPSPRRSPGYAVYFKTRMCEKSKNNERSRGHFYLYKTD